MKKTTILLVFFFALQILNAHASNSIENNIESDLSSSCVVPSYLNKSNSTKRNGTLIVWDAIVPAPEKFEVIVVLKDKPLVSSNIIFNGFTHSNAIDIKGLKIDMLYNVYVRSICNENSKSFSVWSEKMLFDTFSTKINFTEDKLTENLIEKAQTEPADDLRIYPNPATSQFRIQGLEVDKIELFNLLGTKVLEVRATNSVDVSNLNTGAYLIKLTTNDIKVTKKLIVSR